MSREPSPPSALSRRSFLALAPAVAGLWYARASAEPPGGAAEEAGPSLRLPARTRNGAKVPIVVEMAHPMTPDHHVKTIEVVNAADPIPSKGTFHFTPANGRVHLSFQARMHDGTAEVCATAECSRGQRTSGYALVEIPQGSGGCAGSAEPAMARARGPDVSPPAIRIPELVERRGIRPGEIIQVQVKMRHPSRTGLVLRDGAFVAESEPIHLEEMAVEYAAERVSRFELTPALSDDPFITFCLLARREGPLRVVLTNNRGQRFEASHEIRFG